MPPRKGGRYCGPHSSESCSACCAAWLARSLDLYVSDYPLPHLGTVEQDASLAQSSLHAGDRVWVSHSSCYSSPISAGFRLKDPARFNLTLVSTGKPKPTSYADRRRSALAPAAGRHRRDPLKRIVGTLSGLDGAR